MSPTTTSPAQVIQESRNGMLRAAMAVLHNPDDAEDCVQDASLRLVRFWDSFHGQCSTRTWALTLAHNQALDVLRKRRAAKRDWQQDRFDITPSRSHEAQIIARLTLIHAAAQLGEKDRYALAQWVAGYRGKIEVGPALYSRQFRVVRRMRDLCRSVC